MISSCPFASASDDSTKETLACIHEKDRAERKCRELQGDVQKYKSENGMLRGEVEILKNEVEMLTSKESTHGNLACSVGNPKPSAPYVFPLHNALHHGFREMLFSLVYKSFVYS